MPQAGRSGWKGRCAPHASSTINGTSAAWHTSATPAMSAQVPQSVGVMRSMPVASGCSASARRTSSGSGGWASCRSGSKYGCTHTGWMPLMISPATTDLCALRLTSSFSPGPATEIIALFTDSELPQVEKKALSASTASAMRSSAWVVTPCDSRRSSRPLSERTSEAKTPSPTTSTTRRASRAGAREWSMGGPTRSTAMDI